MRDPARGAGDGEDRLPGAAGPCRADAGQRGHREVDVRLGQRPAPDLGQHGLGHRERAATSAPRGGPDRAAGRRAGRRPGTRNARIRGPAPRAAAGRPRPAGASAGPARRGQHQSPRPATPRRAACRSPRRARSRPPRTGRPAPTRRPGRRASRRRARGRRAAPARRQRPAAWPAGARRAAATTAAPTTASSAIRVPCRGAWSGAVTLVRRGRLGRRAAGAGSPPCPAMMRPAGRDHRRRVQVQPQRIGRRHRRDDHLQALERQRPGRQRGLRGPPGRERRRRGRLAEPRRVTGRRRCRPARLAGGSSPVHSSSPRPRRALAGPSSMTSRPR